MQQLEEHQSSPAAKMQAVSPPGIKVRAACGEGERWKLMTFDFNGKASAPP